MLGQKIHYYNLRIKTNYKENSKETFIATVSDLRLKTTAVKCYYPFVFMKFKVRWYFDYFDCLYGNALHLNMTYTNP